MTSSNCYSSVYPFPIDLNQDHDHQNQLLINLNPQPSNSSSSSCPLFFNPPTVPHDQPAYFSSTRDQPQQDHQAKIIYVPQNEHDEPLDESDVSTGLKFSIWKKEEQVLEQDEELETSRNETAAKWMSSKMRIMRKMMTSSDHADNNSSNSSTRPKFEDQKQPSSSSPDNSCSNSSYNNNNNTIRVCADCNTTKTPLWRSGPRGPKSLCNACGIRQRKARRAMAAAAAAAAANGSINNVAAESTKPSSMKISKVHHKAKRSSNNGLKNKKCKLSNSQSHQGRKKLCFEDLRVILSKNSAFHRVFPQDEKEAAILLMALSYGLVHG
ncbi:Zinc finger, GATA-type [Corchorus capsularis]|uniref:Zinc finger, GATA-type n=1 Tax=Corchorus capsularis TaxID=210143 RepID=A0A1R3HAI1_COCAP|nr:Zinc finger, GATA-type [Corchorus capsularis]